MTYKDKTFCGSKDCQGKCGRKLTEADHSYLKSHPYIPVAMSYFCEDDTEDISQVHAKVQSGESSASVADNSSLAGVLNTTLH